jgi:hypothetical protein
MTDQSSTNAAAALNFDQFLAHQVNPAHYHFAHFLLPQLTQSKPDTVLNALTSGDANTFLAYFWGDAKKATHAECEGVPTLAGRLFVPGYTCLLVQMPAPQAITEASLIAIIFAKDPISRYFTLELSADFEKSASKWLMCEWAVADQHLIHKEYAAPMDNNPEHFVRVALNFCSRPS